LSLLLLLLLAAAADVSCLFTFVSCLFTNSAQKNDATPAVVIAAAATAQLLPSSHAFEN
jgi:hypothetical protein